MSGSLKDFARELYAIIDGKPPLITKAEVEARLQFLLTNLTPEQAEITGVKNALLGRISGRKRMLKVIVLAERIYALNEEKKHGGTVDKNEPGNAADRVPASQ